jgi:hypothetical protein
MPAIVQSQPHPCDSTYPTVYREPGPKLPALRVGFCFAPVDSDGTAITEAIGFAMAINGGAAIDLGILPALIGANAAGLAYYEFANAALTAGTITITAYTATLGMSAASAPITLTLLGPPRAPQQTHITRS